MALEDFRSTDLEGAAYYARIYGGVGDWPDDRPSRSEIDSCGRCHGNGMVRQDDAWMRCPECGGLG